MSVHADPLRNTLDHLALDPDAAADRKYLVSMLRRLGYSEAEIRRTLQVDEGEEDRIIEIEYTGQDQMSHETQFEVVGTDEPDFEVEPEPAFEVEPEPGFEVEPEDEFVVEEPEEVEEWDEPELVDFEETEPEEEPEELVEFVERPAEETEDEWAEEEVTEFTGDEAQGEADDLVGFTVTRGRLDRSPTDPDHDPAVAAGWQPVEDYDRPRTPPGEGEWEILGEVADEEAPVPVETSDEPEEPLEEPIEEPAQELHEAPTWEPVEEEVEDDRIDVEEGATELEATTDWAPAETGWAGREEAEEVEQVWDDGAFRYEDYTLYTRTVELSTGREQQIYFFAKSEPKSGEPAAMPDGYVVEVNEKTGLPFLRRGDKSAAPQKSQCAAVTDDDKQCRLTAQGDSEYCHIHQGYMPPTAKELEARLDTKPRAGVKDTLPDEDTDEAHQCAAITAAGKQCSNTAREGSKYCGSHKGYRHRSAADATDTKPVGKRVKDTLPKTQEADTDRCRAITAAGTQCKRSHRENSRFCGIHKRWRGEKVE